MQGPPHGPHFVCLVSGGMKKHAGYMLEDWMPDAPWDQLWHRLDDVFIASDRLIAWGTATRAQTQFQQVYPWYSKCFELLEPYILRNTFVDDTAHVFMCRSGHHRSVAFVELLAQYLKRRYNGIQVWIWHIDHHKTNRETFRGVWNFAYMENMAESDFEKYLEFPLVSAVKANRSDPVPQLQHKFRTPGGRQRRR